MKTCLIVDMVGSEGAPPRLDTSQWRLRLRVGDALLDSGHGSREHMLALARSIAPRLGLHELPEIVIPRVTPRIPPTVWFDDPNDPLLDHQAGGLPSVPSRSAGVAGLDGSHADLSRSPSGSVSDRSTMGPSADGGVPHVADVQPRDATRSSVTFTTRMECDPSVTFLSLPMIMHAVIYQTDRRTWIVQCLEHRLMSVVPTLEAARDEIVGLPLAWVAKAREMRVPLRRTPLPAAEYPSCAHIRVVFELFDDHVDVIGAFEIEAGSSFQIT